MKFIKHTKLAALLGLGMFGMVGATGFAMAVPQELVDGLGDESFALREKAEQDLAQWAKKNGKEGLGILSELKERSKSPEVRSRLNNVIAASVIYKAIPKTRGYMGLMLDSVMGATIIIRVVPDSPAGKSGLKPNDKIIGIDGIDLSKKNRRWDEASTFVRTYVKMKKAGEKLTLKIERGGATITKNLKLGDFDKNVPQRELKQGNFEIEQGFNGGRMRIKILPRGGPDLNPQQLKENMKMKFKLRLDGQIQPQDKEVPPEVQEMLDKLNAQNMELLKKLEKQPEMEK